MKQIIKIISLIFLCSNSNQLFSMQKPVPQSSKGKIGSPNKIVCQPDVRARQIRHNNAQNEKNDNDDDESCIEKFCCYVCLPMAIVYCCKIAQAAHADITRNQ